MDRLAEDFLVSQITSQRPLDGILGEEGADVVSQSGRMWVIDPLDGTVNYLYQLPFWAVSVGLVDVESGAGLVGVIYAPAIGKSWVGARGKGSFELTTTSQRKLAVSDCSTLDRALLGTGFGYAKQRRAAQGRVVRTLLPEIRDIRRMGSCAIDLCLVAEGALDGFFERGVNPWDHAAGSLIAREAGAQVCGLRGQTEDSEMLVAANPQLISPLVARLETLNADSDQE